MATELEKLKESLQAILITFGDESVDLLIDYHLQAGQRTTGKTIEQCESKVEDLNLEVLGADHVDTLEYGRDKGIMPPVQAIFDWAEAKGLMAQFDKEYKKRGFAYVVARKIGQEGSYMFRFGQTFSGFQNPVSKAFSEARLEQLKERLGEKVEMFINSEVLKQFKQKT